MHANAICSPMCELRVKNWKDCLPISTDEQKRAWEGRSAISRVKRLSGCNEAAEPMAPAE